MSGVMSVSVTIVSNISINIQ